MKRSKLKIKKEDLKKIYSKDWNFFYKKILSNCYCGKCKGPYDATIINYEIFLNDLNDVILKGKCKTCGSKIARYMETGEVFEYTERLEEVRKQYEI